MGLGNRKIIARYYADGFLKKEEVIGRTKDVDAADEAAFQEAKKLGMDSYNLYLAPKSGWTDPKLFRWGRKLPSEDKEMKNRPLSSHCLTRG